MYSNQSSNYGKKIKMKKRKMTENVLEANILEIFMETRKINILCVTFATSKIMQKRVLTLLKVNISL